MRRIRLALFAVLALAATSTACSRGVNFDPEPGQTYAVNVMNQMPHAMIISFDDGSGTRLLGTVGGNRTERFVVAGAANPTVSIIARDEAETHTVRRTVTLVAGGTVDVRIN
jgi:hypothetical protein